MAALSCAAYAAAGQKWLCGADGTGMLYVSPAWRERIRPVAPSYLSFEDTTRGPRLALQGRRAAATTPRRSPARSVALSLGALEVLERHGFDDVHAARPRPGGAPRRRLAERGHTVAPRGDTTLVAWEDADPEGARDRLRDAGIVVRNLPGRRCCAPPSAPGTTSPTSIACWARSSLRMRGHGAAVPKRGERQPRRVGRWEGAPTSIGGTTAWRK